MNDFLNSTYYNNTVLQWGIAIGISVACIVVSLVVYTISGRLLKYVTRNTATKLDDILVDMLEEPIVFFVVMLGVRYSLGTLSFSETIIIWIEEGYQFLLTVNIIWLLVRLYEGLRQEYGRQAAFIEEELSERITHSILTLRYIFLLLLIAFAISLLRYRANLARCPTNCMGANLIGFNLTEESLAGMVLVEANLRDANLTNVDLQTADLSGAILASANLSNADLSRAVLIGADLTRADLAGATLDRTDLRGAILDGTNLTKVDLTTTRLVGVLFNDANLIGANLAHVSLSGGELLGADLRGAKLQNSDLSGAILNHADLSGADLQGADLSGAWLNQVNLTGANLTAANLSGASLIGANLNSVDLTQGDLAGATLIGANFNGAILRGTNLHNARYQEAQLQPHELEIYFLGEVLNELQLAQLVVDADWRGVQYNRQTVWPDVAFTPPLTVINN